MGARGPSLGRILAMVGFALSCFGLLLFLWLAFGGPIPLQPKGYRFTASFGEATSLAGQSDVRISGVTVGKVQKLESDKRTGTSTVQIELESRYAPLPADSRAELRQKTLLGETYVELTPGDVNGPKIPEGGHLAGTQVSPTVELDEITRAFDDKTRAAVRTWLLSQAEAVRGRGRDINEALGNLGQLTDDAQKLVDILNRQQPAVTATIKNTGGVFEALTERDGQLRELIENSERVFRTTAERDRELAETFHILPTFNRETQATLARLERFADTTDPLVTQLRPAARELSPTLTDLGRLAPDLRALFRDLDPLIDASKAGFPAASRVLDDLRPFLGQANPFLAQLNPILDFVGLYKREASAFLANTVASTQASDQPPGAEGRVHYLRTTNPVNLENLAVYPRRLGTNRNNPYVLPGGFDKQKDVLEVFDTRHCGRGVPVISQVVTPFIGDTLMKLVNDLLEPVTKPVQEGAIAPPCKQQGKFDFQGVQSQFPQVKAK